MTVLEVAQVDFGRRTLRWRRRGVWLRLDLRTTAACLALVAATLAIAAFALTTGDFALSVREAVAALFSSSGFDHTVVVDWRLPRVLAAVVFGAGLGVSGAIFQSLTRNPLASPDIIGFSTGSYSGALAVMIFTGGAYLQVAGGALLGGLATAAAVYLLAYRRGVQGFRLIVVGIAVSAMLTSLNTFLIMTAKLEVAMSAAAWGAGSLNAIDWRQAGAGALTVIVLLALAATLSRPLRQLELGDDAARALGVRAERTRLLLILIGVALTATVTAAAGPIAFVALAAPQIALRLTRASGAALIPAAATGALLLCAADCAAQRLPPAALPVGIVTVVVGGLYLAWLLAAEARRRL